MSCSTPGAGEMESKDIPHIPLSKEDGEVNVYTESLCHSNSEQSISSSFHLAEVKVEEDGMKSESPFLICSSSNDHSIAIQSKMEDLVSGKVDMENDIAGNPIQNYVEEHVYRDTLCHSNYEQQISRSCPLAGVKVEEDGMKSESPFLICSSSNDHSIAIQSKMEDLVSGKVDLENDIAGNPIQNYVEEHVYRDTLCHSNYEQQISRSCPLAGVKAEDNGSKKEPFFSKEAEEECVYRESLYDSSSKEPDSSSFFLREVKVEEIGTKRESILSKEAGEEHVYIESLHHSSSEEYDSSSCLIDEVKVEDYREKIEHFYFKEAGEEHVDKESLYLNSDQPISSSCHSAEVRVEESGIKMAPTKKYSRVPTPKYSKTAMEAACHAVSEGKKGLREAARLFGVPPSTLKDRLKGRKPMDELKRTVIMIDEERRLVEWLEECARRGFGRTAGQLQRAVQVVLNQRKAVTVFKHNLPGPKWVSLFLKRHPEVSLRKPQALGSQRAAVTEGKLKGWFETAHREITAAGGDVLDHLCRIFNCDETGFQLGASGVSKVLASKKDKRVYQVSTDTRIQITVLACGSASGEVHSPLIIFPGQRFSYNPLKGFPEAHFAKSGNGWIDGDIFTGWLKNVFIPAISHLPKPVLLFADGHKTHLTLTVSELCRDHGIILYLLPSHASHIVQPLDLTTFKLLKQAWREEVLAFQEEHSDTVGKRQFAGVLKKAWERGIKKDAVISGFRAAGIYPWNPDHVDLSKTGPSRLFVTTETETDNTTAGLVPGTPEADIRTLTTTADETIGEDPPSPTTYPSALPPLSESLCSSFPHVPKPSLPPHSHTIVPPSTSHTIPPSTSHTIPPSTSHTIPSSSSSSSHAMFPPTTASSSSSVRLDDYYIRKDAVDRLLDLAVKIGHDGLTKVRSLHYLGIESDDPEERLFCLLYSRLIDPKSTETDTTDNAELRTFDNLPLPSRRQPKRRQTIQPPKMISSDAYRQYLAEMEEKKRSVEEEKERKKKEREERKKRTEDEKQKRKKEQERRKREREEKKAEKEKMKIKKKRTKTRKDNDDSFDSDHDNVTSKCLDSNGDLDIVTTSKCLDSDSDQDSVTSKCVDSDSDQDSVTTSKCLDSDSDQDSVTTSKCLDSDSDHDSVATSKCLDSDSDHDIVTTSKCLDSDSDHDIVTTSKCLDSDSDIDMDDLVKKINANVCSACAGENDLEFFEWIGCECGRWFHIGCLEDASFHGKSLNEIENMKYVCEHCKYK